MKIGAIRWCVDIDYVTGEIHFEEIVLRSQSRRRNFNGIDWMQPVLVNYWIVKHDHVTWVPGKNCKWTKSIPNWMRHSRTDGGKQPGYASKKSALKALLKELKGHAKRHGDLVDEDEMSYANKIIRVRRQISRCK